MALALYLDKNKSVGADGAFKLLSQAWSVLANKDKNCTYDLKLNLRASNLTGSFILDCNFCNPDWRTHNWTILRVLYTSMNAPITTTNLISLNSSGSSHTTPLWVMAHLSTIVMVFAGTSIPLQR
ncbi:hypothetical protein BUALT_Bualt16G0084200 [Buddleja alternifolia]|uniref:Uncharacterized protein n=1 Tax=Buddleja alternifolia TaxID=168488 RepID=A0AAV6WGN5_9LAMI|nr:hypothetical protein BUALT_Bualt16G0084200 [Buddleja alternifolia]